MHVTKKEMENKTMFNIQLKSLIHVIGDELIRILILTCNKKFNACNLKKWNAKINFSMQLKQ
jgi:hypothetical protein